MSAAPPIATPQASTRSLRPDLGAIAEMVSDGSHVLDLGCGDGSLLRWLADHRQVSGYGLEIDADNITRCIARGVNVIEQDLDRGLSLFDPDSFELVILAQTIQAVRHPDRLLQDMLRIAPQCIVTFPNFGHWRCRLGLLAEGRMPVARHLPHGWVDTPNIHLCTIRDFEATCRDLDIRIADRQVMNADYQKGWLTSHLSNLIGAIAIYRLERND